MYTRVAQDFDREKDNSMTERGYSKCLDIF